MHRYLIREWLPLLSGSKSKILSFIIDRTAGWGKTWEVITTAHFLRGVPRRTGFGIVYEGGTGLTNKTVIAGIRDLVDQGFIRREEVGSTFRYSINYPIVGTDQDPGLLAAAAKGAIRAAKIAAGKAVAAAKTAALAAWRETGCGEARALFLSLLSGKTTAEDLAEMGMIRERRSASKIRENGRGRCGIIPYKEEEHNPSVSNDTEDSALTRRSEEEEREEGHIPTPVRIRKRRVDTGAAAPTRSAFIRGAKSLLADSAPAPSIDLEPAPVTAQRKPSTFGEHVRSIATQITEKRKLKAAKAASSPIRIGQVWCNVVADASGAACPAWSPKERGLFRHRVNDIPLPDPSMTWEEVVRWVSGNWGEALHLAVPFMLKLEDKRERLLRDLPSASLFLAMTDHFVTAYARLFLGEGFRPSELDGAQVAQREHAQWLQRRGIIHTQGYEALASAAPQTLTDGEAEEALQRVAQHDEEAKSLVQDRAELDMTEDAYRRRYGSRWRKEMDRAIARKATDEAFKNLDKTAEALGIRLNGAEEEDYYDGY